jgi:hypothetical protein
MKMARRFSEELVHEVVMGMVDKGCLYWGQPSENMRRRIIEEARRIRVRYQEWDGGPVEVITMAEAMERAKAKDYLYFKEEEYLRRVCEKLYDVPCLPEEYDDLRANPTLHAWVTKAWRDNNTRPSGSVYFCSFEAIYGFLKECVEFGLTPWTVSVGGDPRNWCSEIFYWEMLAQYAPMLYRAHKAITLAWGDRWCHWRLIWPGSRSDFARVVAQCTLPPHQLRGFVVAYVLTKDEELATSLARLPFKECEARAEAYRALIEQGESL